MGKSNSYDDQADQAPRKSLQAAEAERAAGGDGDDPLGYRAGAFPVPGGALRTGAFPRPPASSLFPLTARSIPPVAPLIRMNGLRIDRQAPIFDPARAARVDQTEAVAVHTAGATHTGPSTVRALLQRLAWQLVWDVVRELLDGVLRSRYGPAAGYGTLAAQLYGEMQGIYESNGSYRWKIDRLAKVLDEQRLGNDHPLQSYLVLVSETLHATVGAWDDLEQRIQHIGEEQTWLGQLVESVRGVEALLANPVTSRMFGGAMPDQIWQAVRPVRMLLEQVHAVWSMPEGAQWHDYLAVVVAQQQWGPAQLRLWLNLGHELSQFYRVRAYPSDGTPTEQLAWIMEALSDSQVLDQAEGILGAQTVDYLRTLVGVGSDAVRFPRDGGLVRQMAWLFQMLSRVPGMSGAPAEWLVQSLRQILGDDGTSRELFALLMKVTQPQTSWAQAAKAVFAHTVGAVSTDFIVNCMRSVTFELSLHFSAVFGIPKPIAAFIAKTLRGVTRETKLKDIPDILLNNAAGEVRDQLLTLLGSRDNDGRSLRMAMAIGQHQSFGESVRYLAAQVKASDPVTRMGCMVILHSHLTREIYLAAQSGNMREMEGKLRLVARVLKDVGLGSDQHDLDKVIDLIPLIPALHGARVALNRQAVERGPGQSWLEWGSGLIEALEDGARSSQTLSALREALMQQVTDWAAQAMHSGLSQFGSAVAMQMGASAAPAPDQYRAPWATIAQTSVGASSGPSVQGMSEATHVDEPHRSLATMRQLKAVDEPTLSDDEGEMESDAQAAWDADAVVVRSPEEGGPEGQSGWRRAAKIGAGVSVSIGLLAIMASVWRAYRAPPPKGGGQTGESAQEHLLLDERASPYQSTAQSLGDPVSPPWSPDGLTWAALTFGVAIPGGLWGLLHLTDSAAIEEMSPGEVKEVIAKLSFFENHRARRSAKDNASPRGVADVSKKVATMTSAAFVEHFAQDLTEANRAPAKTWLAATLRTLLDEEAAADRRWSALHLTILLDGILSQWQADHTATSADASIAVMEELRARVRAAIVVESSDVLAHGYLSAINVLPSERQTREGNIATLVERLNRETLSSTEGYADYIDLLDEEIEYYKNNSTEDVDSGYIELLRARAASIDPATLEAKKLTTLLEKFPSKETVGQEWGGSPTPLPIINSEAALQSWFDPIAHTPEDFVEQWISLKMRQTGMSREYHGEQIRVTYTIPAPASRGASGVGDRFQFNPPKEERWPLTKIVARSYLKQQKSEGWIHLEFHWPDDYPEEFRKSMVDGDIWSDFKKFNEEFIKSDRAKDLSRITLILAKGLVGRHGKYAGSYQGTQFESGLKRVVYGRGSKEITVAGVFELNGYVYSLYNGECVNFKDKVTTDDFSLLKMVEAGMSAKELDSLQNRPFESTFIPLSQYRPRIEAHPYLSRQSFSAGTFGQSMLGESMRTFYDDMDWAITSKAEHAWDTVADVLSLTLMLTSMPVALATGPVMGVALALLSAIPDAIRMENANTLAEKREAMKTLLLGLVLDLAGETIAPIVVTRLKKMMTRKVTQLMPSVDPGKSAPVIRMKDLEDWSEGIGKAVKGKDDIPDAELTRIAQTGTGMRSVDSVSGDAIQNLRSKIESMPGIGTILDTPREKCALATRQIFDLVRPDFQDVEVVRLLFWRTAADAMPINHFAVRFRRQGVSYIADSTICQFDRIPGISPREIYVGDEAAWIEKMKQAHSTSTIKLQASKSTTILNDKAISHAHATPGNMVVEASWYKLAGTPAQLVLNAKSDLTVRRWFKTSERLKQRLAHPAFKKRLARLIKEKSVGNKVNAMGLSKNTVNRIRKGDNGSRLKSLIESKRIKQLSEQNIESQIDGLHAISEQVDVELKRIAQNVSMGKLTDPMLELKIDVEVRIDELKMRQANSAYKANPVEVAHGEPLAYRAVDVRSRDFESIDLPWREAHTERTSTPWTADALLETTKLADAIGDFMQEHGLSRPTRSLKIELMKEAELIDAFKRDRPEALPPADLDDPATWVAGYTTGEGKVLMAWDHPDFSLKSGEADVVARRSTLIHEAVHAYSKNSRGFQDLVSKNKDIFPGINLNLDEIVTDYIAYSISRKMGFEYVSGYSARDLGSNANRIWIGNFMKYLDDSGFDIDKIIKSYFSDDYDQQFSVAQAIDKGLIKEWHNYAKQMRRLDRKSGNPIALKALRVSNVNEDFIYRADDVQGARPVAPSASQFDTGEAYEQAMRSHEAALKAWRRAGEKIRTLKEVPYGESIGNMKVFRQTRVTPETAGASTIDLSLGHVDIGNLRLVSGFESSQSPANNAVQRLIVSAHGHYKAGGGDVHRIPTGMTVNYPVPFGMIYAAQPIKKIASRISEFNPHSVVSSTQKGGYRFEAWKKLSSVRSVPHTMQDSPFDALGQTANRSDQAGVSVRKQVFNRFADDTTWQVAKAIKANRKHDAQAVDVLVVRPGVTQEVDQAELFDAIKKLNVGRSTPYSEVYMMACRQVKFDNEQGLKEFLSTHLGMKADDIDLVARYGKLDDLQAYNPLGDNPAFRGLPTGRRDNSGASRTKRASSEVVLRLITMQAYDATKERVAPSEVIIGCQVGGRIIELTPHDDQLLSLRLSDNYPQNWRTVVPHNAAFN
ncbi:hypothetical protein FPJ27_15315 [Burkholderia sp. MS455]|uniref:hypothetical protein n=1 Tax=Burkholderia sp. MS455 TaxID=2811788 RepID=UPI00195C51E5|nr:hypothetical protein [Burkholderia sp. MS455]QRR07634.1 hypothetical protein FPJ27_15315 [Burkholderia sp. MS455]